MLLPPHHPVQLKFRSAEFRSAVLSPARILMFGLSGMVAHYKRMDNYKTNLTNVISWTSAGQIFPTFQGIAQCKLIFKTQGGSFGMVPPVS